ncbi:zinc finger SWIM domain protein [Gloeothece citriformis PCC 7424]|uniref:Zinc finger SWIM domain protein n=1 Tax=Gloeothece citriformis (strain PCC 7424) TaxID=65393 RepID=B7K779_GLOC7|nr:SWIM zinc finger family protein [Gloeothece citriformis]ACK69647.1 zinc finger SWIM domain protein [Gloeothece citriformis PCC 7424]
MNHEQISNNQREWWVQRWLELLDSYRFKKRLERGRNYAREGNVLSIDFEGAQVLAKVQGSEPDPYQVSLSIAPFTDEDWNYVIDTLSEKAIFSAQLLAGQMPETIEQVFISNGLNLFPFTLSDVHSRCSCPDKANPCKHIAAVYYQLGDRFSEDPFVMFQLRGRSKENILDALRQRRKKDPLNQPTQPVEKEETTSKTTTNKTKKKSSKEAEKTAINLDEFWKYEEPLDSSLTVIVPPKDQKTLLDVLGRIPLAYAEAEAVEQYLEQVYQVASQQAMITALGRDE